MDMKVRDLKSIVNFCGTDENNSVKVKVRYDDGTTEHCYIESFDQYSDSLVLVVNSNVKPSRKEG